jgi:alpha/beta superfamily hydrolase
MPEPQSLFIPGPTGRIEAAISTPSMPKASIIGIICHPHPLYGGTMSNKVVTTIATAFSELGICSPRFNFRGVGQSQDPD